MNLKLRPTCAAGRFYPQEEKALQSLVQQNLTGNELALEHFQCLALAVPHAGYQYSAATAGQAFRWLAAQPSPKLGLWGPSHYFAFTGLAGNPYPEWELPGKSFHRFTPSSERGSFVPATQAALFHQPEHSLEVELPFIRECAPEATVEAVLFGQLDPEVALKALTAVPQIPFIIVSTDLSHFHSLKEAQKRDAQYLEAVQAGRVGEVLTGEACGRVPLAALVLLAQQNHWECRVLHYDTSATASGDDSSVVGYAALAWGVSC